MALFGSKRAQMFVFVIVAIVLLVIFGLVYLIVSNSKQVSSQSQLHSQMSERLSSSIHNKIQSCLDSTSREALVIAGEQGGYLFKYQGGLTPKSYRQFGVNTVDLSVKNLKYGASYWLIQPNVKLNSYGLFVFPYLSHEDLIPGFRVVTIQDNLESYVLNNFEKCFNLEDVKAQFNNSNAHLTGVPKVSVVFNKKNVVFKLHYPLSAYGKQYSDFVSTVNVPFSQMYYAAQCFVNHDIHNLSFDVDNFADVCKPPRGISLVPVITAGSSNGAGYSLLAVNSSQQDLNMNTPVVLYFIRMNRRPVLFNLTSCARLDSNPLSSTTLSLSGGSHKLDFTNCVADPDADSTYITFGRSYDGKNKIYANKIVNFNCTSPTESVKYYVQAYDPFLGSDIQFLSIKCES